jgi:hypothetical protein
MAISLVEGDVRRRSIVIVGVNLKVVTGGVLNDRFSSLVEFKSEHT